MVRACRLAFGAATAGLLVPVAVPVIAQEAVFDSVTARARPEYDPLGFELDRLVTDTFAEFTDGQPADPEGPRGALSSFVVMPKLETNFGFTSNIYRTNTDVQSDQFLEFKPTLRIASDWDNHSMALLIDGVHVGDHCLIVALGIAADGQKHALGLWDGSTENATVCQGLLANLQSRGLRTDRSLLVILDGSKALRKRPTLTRASSRRSDASRIRATSASSRPSVLTTSAPSKLSWATLETSPTRCCMSAAGISTRAV